MKMTFLKNILIVACCLFFVVGCSNQTGTLQDFTSQVALSDAGFASLAQLDWDGYAAQLEPSGLEKFNAMLKPGIEKLILASKTDSVNLFGKNYNSQELQSLSSSDFFVVIMTMVSDLSPDIKSTFGNMTNMTMGAVAEGDSLVHVVIKTQMMIGTQAVNEMNIQSVMKKNDEWKLKMSPKIEGIALMLSQQMPR